MQIVCTTVESAEHVLTMLMHAQLRPRQDFAVRSEADLVPPITFMFPIVLPTMLLSQICALPDIALVREAGA